MPTLSLKYQLQEAFCLFKPWDLNFREKLAEQEQKQKSTHEQLGLWLWEKGNCNSGKFGSSCHHGDRMGTTFSFTTQLQLQRAGFPFWSRMLREENI